MDSISPNSASTHESGFTLLEVLISIAIMSAIAVSIYQITTKTFELREKLMSDGEFYNGIRMAMGIVERDVSMMYSPMLMVPEKPARAQTTSGPSGPADPTATLGRTDTNPLTTNQLVTPMNPEELAAAMGNDPGRISSRFWLEAVHKSGIRPSRFQGQDSKMSFISVSNLRVYKESLESEFAKIEYLLEDDKTTGAEPGTKILVKKTTPNAFDDDESFTNARQDAWKSYLLLPGIKKLSLRYYRKEKDQWQSSWDNDSPELKLRYPDMIEINLEVVGPSRLQFQGRYLFRPETLLRGVSPSG